MPRCLVECRVRCSGLPSEGARDFVPRRARPILQGPALVRGVAPQPRDAAPKRHGAGAQPSPLAPVEGPWLAPMVLARPRGRLRRGVAGTVRWMGRLGDRERAGPGATIPRRHPPDSRVGSGDPVLPWSGARERAVGGQSRHFRPHGSATTLPLPEGCPGGMVSTRPGPRRGSVPGAEPRRCDEERGVTPLPRALPSCMF